MTKSRMKQLREAGIVGLNECCDEIQFQEARNERLQTKNDVLRLENVVLTAVFSAANSELVRLRAFVEGGK